MAAGMLRNIIGAFAILAFVAACSSGPPKPTVGGRGTSETGRIVGMLETEAAPQRNTGIGRTAGGIAGLLVGIAIGSNDTGRVIGAVAGYLIGSILGNAAEAAAQGAGKKVTEFTVELDTGGTIVVVGDNGQNLEVGDRVTVIDNGAGSRLERSTAPAPSPSTPPRPS